MQNKAGAVIDQVLITLSLWFAPDENVPRFYIAAAAAWGWPRQMAAGPMRPPYTDLPEDWQTGAQARDKAWAKLRRNYAKAVI